MGLLCRCPSETCTNEELSQKNSSYIEIQYFTYRNTELMVIRADGKFVRVVKIVRWEQFTQQLPVDIRKCSQVIRKAWSDS